MSMWSILRSSVIRHRATRGLSFIRTYCSSDFEDETSSPFTRLRSTADHTLPGLPQLRSACRKLVQDNVTDPEIAVLQLRGEVGANVVLGRFVVNLNHPDLLATMQQLQLTGYTLHQILDDPRLLNKSAQEELLASLKQKNVDQQWLDTLADKLATTADELLHRAPAKMNAFHPRRRQAYLDKIDVLLQSGARQDEILDCLGILNRSLSCIKTRCREVLDLGLADNGLPLKLLNQGQNNFSAMIEYRKETMDVLGSHADAWHCLADKLDTTPELVRQRLKPCDLVGTVQKIDLLLEMGLTRDDIILRPRLITFSVANILRAKLVIEDHDMRISSASLSYFLEKNSFPSKKNKQSMMDALCVLLNCSIADIREHFKYMDTALTSTISSIEKAIALLVEYDITLADIAACPLVLNYDYKFIERAFSDADILPLGQWKNKVKLLNALVYTLGRYEPVTGVEVHSPHDEDILHEYGEDLVEEADEFEQDFVVDEGDEEIFADRWTVPSRLADFGFV